MLIICQRLRTRYAHHHRWHSWVVRVVDAQKEKIRTVGPMSVDLTSRVTAGDVSVVVCAYTLARQRELIAAIESVIAQQDPVREIIVVVDYNDDLLEWTRAHYPQLQVVPNAKGRGLSGARDTGTACCSGTVVAFLDDDARAAPQWAHELARTYAAGEVLGAGGWIEPDWVSCRPSWWPQQFDWVVGCSYAGLPTHRAAVRNMIGANMSLRRGVLVATSGFDARLGRIGAGATGGEETEMCIRVRSLFPTGEIVFEPLARVMHRVGPERATWRYFIHRCWGEGQSKARLRRMTSPEAALSTERDYVMRTLPRGALAGLVSRDPRRGLAVVAGLAVTTLAYVHCFLMPVRCPKRHYLGI